MTWEPPSHAASFFPKTEGDRLGGEDDYLHWSIRIKSAFKVCGLWEIVEGKEKCPATDATNIANWNRKNQTAVNLLLQCVKQDLVIKVAEKENASEIWDTFKSEFGQTGTGSVILWFRRLATQLPSGGDISAHITGFQEAIRYLQNAGFTMPEYISASFLLSTLPADPKDPESWHHYVAGVKIDDKTTLTSTINGILEEKRRLKTHEIAETQKQDSTYAAMEKSARSRGKQWCSNCKREGHATDNCWSKGGAKYGQRPSKPKKKGKKDKRKAKEKANHADDEGSSNSDEDSHHVRLEKSLSTREVNFSDYISGEPKSDQPLNDSLVTKDSRAEISLSASHIIDSGTSSHIHSDRSDFSSMNPSNGKIMGFGNGSRKIEGRGSASLDAKLPKGGTAKVKLQDTCFVPNTNPTLISVGRLDDAKCYTLFGHGKCLSFEKDDDGRLMRELSTREKVIFTGTKKSDRLYHLDTPAHKESAHSTTEPTSELEKLHQRLGHLNYNSVKALVRHGMATGIKLSKKDLKSKPPFCGPCCKGKMTRASFPISTSGRHPEILGLVHSDLWGHAPTRSLDGSRYIIHFTDDNSRWVWVYFLKHKNEAFDAFKEWLVLVENETGKRLKAFHTDGGGEFVSTEWKNFMKKRGIFWSNTSSYTPEQNGVAERLNGTIMNYVRTQLIDAGLPLYLWRECVSYTIWLKNRFPSNALPKHTTPHLLYKGKKPDLSRAHRFGCRAFLYNNSPARKKLDPRAEEVIFVGVSDNQKAWKVYRPKKRSCYRSVHVRFDDSVVGNFSSSLLPSEGENYSALKNSPNSDDELDYPSKPKSSEPSEPPRSSAEASTSAPSSQTPRPKAPRQKFTMPPREKSSRLAATTTNPYAGSRWNQSHPSAPSSSSNPSTNQIPFPSVEQEASQDQLGSSDIAPGGESSVADSPSSQLEAFLLFDEIDEWALVASSDDPRSLKEAMESPDWAEWEAAMQKEFESITRLGTFELGELPPDRKAIGSRWVFRKKRGLNDEPIYKARIVAQGFTQIPGVDFFQTYAPVARIESIRLLMAIAASEDWEFHIVDVDSAFLNSTIPDDQPTYMKQPPGYVAKGKEDLVWILLKALYGLKQSANLWYNRLKDILEKIGFKVLKSDPCIFIRRTSSGISIISAHVDDLGLFCHPKPEMDLLKSQIRQHVSIKDQGEGKLILGMEVGRNREKRIMWLSHRHLIDKVVVRFRMQDAKPVRTPMNNTTRLSKADCPTTPEEIAEMRKIPYQEAVGSLMHIAVNTRPDISYAVQQVAQFMSNPGMAHWKAVKRIIAYLKTTRDLVLTLGGDPSQSVNSRLLAYCDADHANSRDHARSISGYGVFFGDGVFSWSAKKQTSTATSTGEAELYAGVHAGTEVTWVRQLLSELGLNQSSSTPLLIDNQSAISMIDPPSTVRRLVKHVNISYYWIRDAVQSQIINPSYIDTENNISDIFTKPLSAARHQKLVKMLGLVERPDAR